MALKNASSRYGQGVSKGVYAPTPYFFTYPILLNSFHNYGMYNIHLIHYNLIKLSHFKCIFQLTSKV